MIGRSLKHYQIESTLGKGGMGVVYRARDSRLDRAVAIKVLPEHLTSDPDRRRRFLREARAACSVSHPAIAQVFDVDEAEDGIFIVMELVEGRTVRDLVAARELDLLGAVEIGVQVAHGLAKAHEAGIVHRDIKADNIMVTPDGHAKILDFGLAKLLEPAGVPSDAPAVAARPSVLDTRTQAGLVLGTVGYMSPEQARGQPLDQRSDIFSLGIVLYEMVTGQSPFGGTSPIDTLHAIAYEETRPVSTIRTGMPASLDRVIGRCLKKKPEERYQEAQELAVDLKRVQREIETGISQAIPLLVRLREGLRTVREMTPGEWIFPIAVAIVLGMVAIFILRQEGDVIPGLVFFGVIGLLIYRQIRNRGRRLMVRFAAKVKKMPEVRVITLEGRQATVLVDRAIAANYVRINSLMDSVNRKMFFGDPYSVVVRDDLGPEEVRALLRRPGVLHVRPDVLGEPGR